MNVKRVIDVVIFLAGRCGLHRGLHRGLRRGLRHSAAHTAHTDMLTQVNDRPYPCAAFNDEFSAFCAAIHTDTHNDKYL